MSNGIVSALRDTGDGTLIQTSAAISPGSSGGGLFNDQGRLMGITTFKVKGGDNVNIALPVSWVSELGVTGAAAPNPDATAPPASPAQKDQPQAVKNTDTKRSIPGWVSIVFGVLVIVLLAFGRRLARWLAERMDLDR